MGWSKIPLGNCYWCKCAWCVYGWTCEDKDCFACMRKYNLGKVPYIRENCEKWLPRTIENSKLVDEVQKCRNCKYKKAVKAMLGKFNK